jgi:N utilization substance protein B
MSLRQRSHARVLALQALCLFDALGDAFADQLERFLADPDNYSDLDWRKPPMPDLIIFARSLALGAWQERAASDALLARHVVGWSVQRMQPVDRNILRLGLYELLKCPDRPHQVVLNEAVELARRFGGAESPAFVNGVLDGLRKELAARATEAGAPTQER